MGSRATIAIAASVAALVLLAAAVLIPGSVAEHAEPVTDTKPAGGSSSTGVNDTAAQVHPGSLYGRITAADGAVYEGWLRWGRDQEASWGDYFDGTKDENRWSVHASLAQPSDVTRAVEIFGFEIGSHGPSMNLRRPFMARFGDIARIDADGGVRVTLKSGAMFELDRSAAGDIDDGVRVWDGRGGVADLDGGQIRTVEFLPAASAAAAAVRLHGTVRTLQGDFAGHIQWNRQDSIGADELSGRTPDGEVSLRYDTIRSIARHSRDSARVTLLDGREMVLSGSREAGQGNLGTYVDDPRFGRVLIFWDALDRIDFTPAGSSPAYDDFPPGRPLTGNVTTGDGRRLAGRLVYDFDESATTETMDADLEGVSYNIPFGLIASIAPRGPEGGGAPRATVILHDGEELHLARTGDLAEGNAGLLIFVDGAERPEYVRWPDVARIDFERPPAMYPPLARR